MLDFEFATTSSQRQQRPGNRNNRGGARNYESYQPYDPDEDWEPIPPSLYVEPQRPQAKKEGKKTKKEPEVKREPKSRTYELPSPPISNEELLERNRLLIGQIKTVMGNREKQFLKIRQATADFVNGETMKAPALHQLMLELLGDSAHPILIELIALLPDAKKKTDLKAVHDLWFTSQPIASPTKEEIPQKQLTPRTIQSQRDEAESLSNRYTQLNLEESNFPTLTDAPVVPNLLSVGVYSGRMQQAPTKEDFPALVGSAPANPAT